MFCDEVQIKAEAVERLIECRISSWKYQNSQNTAKYDECGLQAYKIRQLASSGALRRPPAGYLDLQNTTNWYFFEFRHGHDIIHKILQSTTNAASRPTKYDNLIFRPTKYDKFTCFRISSWT